MTTDLDVLLLDGPSVNAGAERLVLEGAGHRVHGCHRLGDDSFACAGILDDQRCPLDGPIDVALVVRRGSVRIEPLPDGARCAIRHDVPLVVQGADQGHPLAPWVTHQVESGESILSACVAAAHTSGDPLRRAIDQRIVRVLDVAGIPAHAVSTDIERRDDALVVHLSLPVTQADPRLRQALAVRVLDAIRSCGSTHGQVGVLVHTA